MKIRFISPLLISFMTLSFTARAQNEKPAQTKTQTTTTVTTTHEQTVADSSSQTAPQQDPGPGSPGEKNPSSWKGFHIGGVVQATFTDIKVKGEGSTLSSSYVVGYGGGGFIGYFFSRHAELRIEALYSSLAQEIVENDVKRQLNLSYMNFPLLLGLHTGYDKPVSFNITAGPQVGINTGSSLDGKGSEGVDTVQASINVRPADIGIAYGAGIDIGFGPEKLLHLNVGFRGVYGIVDISKESNNSTTSNYYILDRAKLKTYSGYAGVSYKF